MTLDFTVNSNDTISGEMVMAVSDSLLEMAGTSFDEALESSGSSSPFGEGAEEEGTIEPYAADGFTGQKFTFDSVPLDRFAQTSDTTGMSLAITRDGSVFKLSGGLDLASQDPEAANLGELGDLDLRVSITFPGKVTQSNGEVEGNKVTWTPKLGEANTFEATASAGGSSAPLLVIGIVVLVLLVVAGAVVIFAVRSSRKKKALAKAAAQANEAAGTADGQAFQAAPVPTDPALGYPAAGEAPGYPAPTAETPGTTGTPGTGPAPASYPAPAATGADLPPATTEPGTPPPAAAPASPGGWASPIHPAKPAEPYTPAEAPVAPSAPDAAPSGPPAAPAPAPTTPPGGITPPTGA
jgi:type II secretory pathway pseudopilin PulG